MSIKALKKFITYFFLAFGISIFLSILYLNYNKLPDSFDDSLRDSFFNIRGEIKNQNDVVIVDIDERSLKSLGQWPWSRNKISVILENLTNANVAIIGLDIVFAEEDNSSPHKVFEKFNIKTNNIPNYDEILSKTIQNTPTILGYQFELEEDSKYISSNTPDIPAIFIEKNKPKKKSHLIKAYGTILNTPILQTNGYSSGFFNNIPDESGIIRSVPLLISYDDIIYPSLSLEIIRILSNSKKVYINYDENGVKNISLNTITIPTDRHGRLTVNFRGKEKNFKYFSATDVYKNNFDKKELENKIVLIGASAAGILDLRATPYDFVFPGVEVHANVIDNIIQEDFIYKPSWADSLNIIIIFTLSFLIVFLTTYTPFWVNPIIMVLSSIITLFSTYYLLFYEGLILNIFFPLITIVIASTLATLLDYIFEVKKEEAIKKKFASKVSKEVMNNLLKNIDSNEFQAMEKEITIFFSDIREFTKISEEMNNPKKLIKYVNQYMEPMSNIITKYEGTIDKYIGDAIMAYWNAPIDVQNHEDKALEASLQQIKQLEELNFQLKKENQPLIDIGIGLNTGEAIIGEMGSINRSDYTVIGDSVNLASRLESLCKYYDSKINISNYTKNKLKKNYVFRFLDLVTVKGKSEPVEIWQVYQKGTPYKHQKEELSLYHEGIELYKKSKFKDALLIFEELEKRENKTNKNIYKIYIDRCKIYIENPPINFKGVFEHVSKK